MQLYETEVGSKDMWKYVKVIFSFIQVANCSNITN